MNLTPFAETLARFKAGEMVALLDRPEREGEADILLAAELVTPEKLNFMSREVCGLITLAIDAARLRELRIPLIAPANRVANMPRFSEPVDYVLGTTTGISVFDRAITIRAMLDPDARPEDFARPGHIFPLAAAEGGLAEREGHTEGAVTLARLAGLQPAVVMCELMAPDGHMAVGAELREWLAHHDAALVDIPLIQEAERRGK
jgi:3,4-dihydroxy-2-butanone 4-phosphate synthase